MNNKIKEELNELKEYCYQYLNTHYGINNNYIKKTKITKNGLFIYGHKVYAPGYSVIYQINTFINWYECNNYKYINDMLEYFVLDCKRLNEFNPSN